MTEKLKNRDLTALLINIMLVKILFTYPRYIIERCENGGFISVLIYGAAAFILYYVTSILYQKTGRHSIIEQAEILGGRVLKGIVGILVVAVLIVNVAPMIRAFPEAVKTVLLKNTSMLVIIFILSVGVALGTYFGISSLCRFSSLFVPVAGTVIFGLLLLLCPYFNINNIFPINFKAITLYGSPALSIFADIFVINLLLPQIKDTKTAKKSGFIAIIAVTVIAALIVLAYSLVYPYPASSQFIVPVYQLARLVKIGTYFERLEAAFEFVWTIAIFIYSSAYLYLICKVIKDSFNLKSYKPLIIPSLLVLMRFVFFEENYTMAQRSNFVSTSILYIPLYILPFIIGILTLRRHKND
ncbi:MAG: GerAB/ArcD/ProY family transporter [Clostridia bacterium]|nr:GerAB/ArcD/ProY family transporter [Clostridia bacterium]